MTPRLAAAVLLLAALATAQDARPAVVGRVVDVGGRPLAGIRVERDGTVLATTGDDGRFELPALPDGAVRRVTLSGRGRASAEVLVSAGATEPFVLPRGGLVVGRVADDAGAPVAGARVEVRDLLTDRNQWLPRTHSPYVARATTKADGTFLVPGALPSMVVVHVEHDELMPARAEAPPPGVPVEVVLLRPREVRGVVLGVDGKPAAGATVAVQLPTGSSRSTVADDDGRFVVAAPPHAGTRLTAVVHVDDGFLSGQAVAAQDLAEPLEIRLAASNRAPNVGAIPLRVRGTDGGVPAAVRAYAVPPRRSADDIERAFAGTRPQPPDVGGVVTVHGEPARVEVTAAGHGRIRLTLEELPKDPVPVELPPPSAIRGRLVDPAGNLPLAEVGVAVMRREDWDDPDFVRRRAAFGIARPPAPPEAARTDADGRFELAGLGPGTWVVYPLTADRPRIEPVAVELQRGDDADDVRVAVPAGATVEVRFEPGALPAGCRVRLAAPGGPFSASSASDDETSGAQLPDARGVVVFRGLPAAPHRLELVLAQPLRLGAVWKHPLREVAVQGAQQVVEVDAAACAPRAVRGRVRFEGPPLPPDRAWVVAEPRLGANNSFWGFLRFQGPVAPLAPDSSFELRLPPGTYDLLVIDAATRAVLTRPHELVVPTATREVEPLALTAAITHVRVTLTGSATARRSIAQLHVDLGTFYPNGVGRIARTPPGRGASGVGIATPVGQDRFELWLPRGELRMTAYTGAFASGAGGLRELELDTRAAERLDVEFPLER